MSLLKIVEEMERLAHERHREQEILTNIAAITSLEFAEQVTDTLDSRKHWYDFETYLILLKRLLELIRAGVPNCQALEAVQTGEPVERILEFWKCYTKEGVESDNDKERIRDISNIKEKSGEAKE